MEPKTLGRSLILIVFLASALFLLSPSATLANPPPPRSVIPAVLPPPTSPPPAIYAPADCVPGNQVDSSYFSDLLTYMGIPVTQFAMDALWKWEPYENTTACWNPLATTLPANQVYDLSCSDTIFNGVGVRNYSSKACGVHATGITILYTPNGSGTYYKPIRDMLSQQSFDWQSIHDALIHWIGSDAYASSLANEWQTLWNNRGGGGSCPSVSSSVYLWDQKNCQGNSVYANATGGWDLSSNFNDHTWSIAISSGWSVSLYKDSSWTSPSVCITSTASDLSSYHYSDGSSAAGSATWMWVYGNSNCSGGPVQPPAPPSLGNPANGGSYPYNYNLTFQWNSSSGATDYLIEWWGGPYSPMQPCSWTTSTSCPIGQVAAGNTYYWHVMARNGAGQSNWSDTWSFTIQAQQQPPAAPSLSSPGNGSSNPYNYDLNFVWNSSSGATDYLLEWWGGPYSTMQPCGWETSTSCHIGQVVSGNTYYWHVMARNGAGQSNWSDTWSFTVQSQNQPPDIPANLRVTGTTQPSASFAWDDVSTETGYKVYKWSWDGTQWTFIYLASVGQNVTTYTDQGLTCA
ncbi:MAG: fibronectin type III domain-containing protein, partial [Anaerolineae bacterium]